jgi:ABC-2 type transport system permease protein/lipopolysaccharide transport system permease protein
VGVSQGSGIVAEGPPAELRFRRHLRIGQFLRDFWRSRGLVRVLAEREFQSRYKQTLLGIIWALLTPVLLVIVFAVFVNRAFDIKTGDAPYILFAYIGLIPWNFFSFSLTRGGQSLVVDAGVINKVRCPREVFPISGMASAGIDMFISLFLLGGMFIATGYEVKTTVVWVPLIFVLQLTFVAGVVLVFAILGVYFRDLYQAMPLLLQLGLLATPVAYGIEAIPEKWWSIYAAINPLAAVIESYRETMLYGYAPPWDLFLPAAAASAVWLIGGFVIFKKLEPGIADVA